MGLFALLSARRKYAFVKRVIRFLVSRTFADDLFRFMDENEGVFRDHAGVDEHLLEFSQVHSEFCAAFETKVSEFIESEKYSLDEFYEFVKQAHDNDNASMVGFVNTFVAIFDYQTFTDVMKSREKRKYLRQIVDSWASEFRGERSTAAETKK